MPQPSSHPRLRRRVVVVLALAFACTMTGPLASAGPLDGALQAVTCSGLLDGVPEALRHELAAVVDTTYCHAQSDAVVCAPPGTVCTVAAEDEAHNGKVQAQVAGTANPGGPMVLAVGRTRQTHDCGKPLYVGVSVRFESEGVSDIVATHRISKAIDQETPQNGAGNIAVCYQSPKPFTDRDGASTMSGLLALCEDNGGQAPCILQRFKNKADAIVQLKLPEGDPTWKMVQDTIDKATG